MKFKDMLPKADGNSTGAPAPIPAPSVKPPVDPPVTDPPAAERTHFSDAEKEQEAEDERDKVNLEKRYPKMTAAIKAGGLDKSPILPS